MLSVRIVLRAVEAERQAWLDGDLLIAAIRRQVAGVGKLNRAIGSHIGAEAGGESAYLAIAEYAIEMGEQFGRRVGIASGCSSEDEGSGHGGAGAFAADIADEQALATIGQDAALVKVAAHFPHGAEGDLDPQAGCGFKSGWGEHALDVAGGLHLAGQDGALFGDLALFAEEQGQQGCEQSSDSETSRAEQSGAPKAKTSWGCRVAEFRSTGRRTR